MNFGKQPSHPPNDRKRMTEADAKLKRLYDAIESGVTDLSDLMLKDRIAELRAIRDQARAGAERAEGAIERLGPIVATRSIKTFARTARKRMRTEGGGYRRDYLRALAQRVEVDAQELRIMGSKANCCARSSPPPAQKRRILACPVLYRGGARRHSDSWPRLIAKMRSGDFLFDIDLTSPLLS